MFPLDDARFAASQGVFLYTALTHRWISRGRIQISGSIPGPTQNIVPSSIQRYVIVAAEGTPAIRRKEISSRWRAEGFTIAEAAWELFALIDRRALLRDAAHSRVACPKIPVSNCFSAFRCAESRLLNVVQTVMWSCTGIYSHRYTLQTEKPEADLSNSSDRSKSVELSPEIGEHRS